MPTRLSIQGPTVAALFLACGTTNTPLTSESGSSGSSGGVPGAGASAGADGSSFGGAEDMSDAGASGAGSVAGMGGVGGTTAAGGAQGGAMHTGGATQSGGADTSGGQSSGGTAGMGTAGNGTAGNGSAGMGQGGADSGTSLTVDVFGIQMLKATKVPGYEWNSLHWANGTLRTFDGRDPDDPTGWSIRRGNGNLMEIDGQGLMAMGGNQSRFYFQPQTGATDPFFRDVEFTGYYRRTASDGAFNAGFNVGIRSGLNGHGDVDHCLATTYYLSFRNSGAWLWYKELDHPNGASRQGGTLLEGGGAIPVGKWIGMKYLAYNLPGETSVKLEAYIDATSDGAGTGPWVKLGETIDAGDWTAPVGAGCGYPGNTVVTQGGGVVFIRNTDVARAEYTKLSWREIVDAPPSGL